MKKLRRIASIAAALVVGTSSLVAAPMRNSANAAYGVGGTGNNVVEYLDRGINAINTGNGMFISWRWNANDADDAEFRLYRDNNLIYTSKSGDATSYLDKDGKSSSKYRVDTLTGGKVVSSEECRLITNSNYFNIPLKKPGSNYTPNDCSVGDVDGDGQYEIFLKWDPSNSKDNSQEGKTDNVYIDCYTLEGKQLWRIDLGKNIRAGQHYTQFLVADFDLDGKAEMTCKTADGTVDGTGKVIGDASKDYRNSKGYVLDGPEYYTLFDGATGKALDTVNYEFPRGKVSDWGDNYGNRVDRFLGTVAYLDGVRPSAVSVRGYYTRMTVVAYDVVDKKLKVKWKHDSGNDKKKGYSGGNHNCMPADVDNDGKQEIFLGATCIDHDGKVLWANGRGHGDAMHLGDLIPDRPGLEAWVCHEEKEQGGVSLLDARTGEAIFHKHTGKDTGRCAADNVYAGNKGAEFWGAESGNVYDSTGKAIGTNRPAQNFFIYWDGDLEREILDGTKITKYTSPTKIDTIFTANGCTSINSTKSVPCLTADIMGDWREELIMAASDGNSIRIYCTPTPTKVRLTTLMHDVQYRAQVATEQNCYNQPPHVSYYLGSDVALPERPNVKLNNAPQSSVPDTPGTSDTPDTPPTVTAVSMKFDLGANAQNGFTSVSANNKYDKNKGYGFSGNDVKDVAAAGKNELSDAVQFTGNTTFDVDLPNGLYKVKVTLGNTSRTSVYMENQLQIVNMTNNNAVDEILIPITDGQLNIRAAAGKSGTAFSISSIEIDKVSDEAVLPSTIWLCGDSTVCNYYPLDTSTQGGWGQMLGHYVDKGWNIRNMAASGSYAQDFANAGNFATIEKYGKTGDVFIISIGINDSKYYDGAEYKKIITDMVKRAKAKGMDVILVKQQGRDGDAQRNPLLTSRWFAAELDQVGKEQNCQVVDLFKLWQDYCISVGAAKTTAMYMSGDTLHPNRSGAEKLAELFASQFGQKPSDNAQGTPSVPPVSSGTLEGKLVKNLVVKDTANSDDWSISGSTSTGGTIFGDRDYTYNSLPDVIKGAEAIMTACDSKNTDSVLAEFTAGADIDVYILLDTRVEENASVPAWLSDWAKTGLTAESSNDVTFSLYKKTYGSGETVTLGTNGMSGNVINYTVFVKEADGASSEQPAVTLWGDANCDGNVTVADAVAIMQHIGNRDKYGLSAQGLANADVDGAAGVTASDSLVIQQIDAGIYKQSDLPLGSK